MQWVLGLVERGWIPDPLVRCGTRRLLRSRFQESLSGPDPTTALAWLENIDRHSEARRAIFKPVYGTEAERWLHRWGMIFLACTELFSYRQGEEWFVSHTLWIGGEMGGPS